MGHSPSYNLTNIVSIAGKARTLAVAPEQIPIVSFSKAGKLDLTHWYHPCESFDEAARAALRSGLFDGVIVICPNATDNKTFYVPAR